VLVAFVAGLVLFALATSGGRKDEFYRADITPPTATGPGYAPLPTPLPAARDTASGLGKAPPVEKPSAEKPRLVETTPPPIPPQVATAPKPVPASTLSSDPMPIPGQSPAPRYPSQALRRGESGTVALRVEIGADGVPNEVGVANSSGSRQLDRAAMDAVRRWRFSPATRQGEAVAGTVVVPITFDARR
jgi:protein TonB